MRTSPSKFLRQAVALIFLMAVVPGCVKRMSPVGESAQMTSPRATLQSLRVDDEETRTRIVLTSDKPFTYTSYKEEAPPRVVVDLSQTEPGSVGSPVLPAGGNIRKIDVGRQEVGGGALTRIELSLVKDTDFTVTTDPTDKTALLISVNKPQGAPSANAAPAEAAAPKAPEPKPEEAAATASKASEAQVKPAEEAKPQAAETKTMVAAAEAAPAVSAQAPAAAAVEPTNKPAEAAPKAEAATAEGNPKKEYVALESKPEPGSEPQQVPVKGRALTGISAVPDGVELTFQGHPETFNSFKLTKPDRIVIDVFGTRSALGTKVVPIGALGVGNARIGTTPDKVRVVLDASRETLPPYDVVKTDSGLMIRLKGVGTKPAPSSAPTVQTSSAMPPAAIATASSQPAAAEAAQSAVSAKLAAAASAPAVSEPAPAAVESRTGTERAPRVGTHGRGMLEAVDFKILDGFSRISLKMSPDCIPGKPVHGPQGLSLSVRNCQLPKKLQRALDTSAFGGSVLSVTPYQVKTRSGYVAKFLVKVQGNPPSTLHREGELLVWDIKNPQMPQPTPPPVAAPSVVPPPPVRAAASAKAAPAAPMEEELRPTSEEGVFEIPRTVSSEKKVYKGRRITLEFSDADVRKIFQLIAEVSNLNFLISDDVTGTISLKLVNVPWDQALDVILDAKDLGMVREGNIVQIKPRSRIKNQAEEERAAKAAAESAMELKTMIFEVNYASVADVQKQFESVKTPRGKISVDERTNRLIVKDIQPALDDMRNLLKTIDIPEKQVMIEARIVEATTNFTRDLGVQWGLNYKNGAASFANINSVETGFGGVVSTAGPSDTGAGGMALGMSFGKLTSNIQLDMRLSASATVGLVKVISTPKVVTLNNKAAKISQGQSIPYQTTSAEGTKTEFVEAALTLEVTPHITSDGSISMKIKASNNSPGTGSPPPINKKEATTELLLANGETTVIGGIYQDSDTENDTGVPFLMDIPLLGWLFKSNSKVKTKTELLIFITPKIVS